MGVAHEKKSAVIEEDHARSCHFDAEALSATFNPILRKDGRYALYSDMSTGLIETVPASATAMPAYQPVMQVAKVSRIQEKSKLKRQDVTGQW
jgi:hypothetical protein